MIPNRRSRPRRGTANSSALRTRAHAMQIDRLGPIIAVRRLHRLEDAHAKVEVRIGLPQPGPESWSCPYQIAGLGHEQVRAAIGVDAVQALELVLRILPVELEVLRQGVPDLRWEDAPPGDFAFGPERGPERS